MSEGEQTGISRLPPAAAVGTRPVDAKAPAPPRTHAAPMAAGITPADAVAELTPEEQMELFAEDLKNNDWGHRPC